MSISITSIVVGTVKVFAFVFAFAHKAGAEAYGDSGRDFVPEEPLEPELVLKPIDAKLRRKLLAAIASDCFDDLNVDVYHYKVKRSGNKKEQTRFEVRMLPDNLMGMACPDGEPLFLQPLGRGHYYAESPHGQGIIYIRVK